MGMGMDWEDAALKLGAAIGVIRDVLSSSAKVEVMRERLGLVAERLDLAKDQLTNLGQLLSREESRSAKLEEELAKMREENRALEMKVATLHLIGQPEPFAERGGFLFKRDATGRWSDITYCPNCKSVIVRALQHLACSNKHCGWAMQSGTHRMLAALAALRNEDAIPGKAQSDYDPITDS